MDLSKLNGLSTETLTDMQAHIKAVLAARVDTTLQIGRIAKFKDSNGVVRSICIERINGKTVSGRETGTSLKPGGKWRVGKGFLEIEPIARQSFAAPPKVPHRPTTSGDAW